MWTPPQWAVAFPIVAAIMLGLDVLLLWAGPRDVAWAAIAAAGLLAGLFAAIGWTLRPLLPPVAMLCLVGAFTAVAGAEAAMAGAGAPSLIVAIVVCGAWAFAYHGAVTGSLARPVAREAEHFGAAQSPRRALIIHHPSPRGFHTLLQRAFAEALAEQGWRVTLTTAHPANEADIGAHDLLVLGSPAYNFRPARALVDAVRRMRGLTGRDAVLVVSGGGMTEAALRFLHALAQRKGARVRASLEIWTSRSNAERHGIDDPQDIMRRAAGTTARALAENAP